MLKTRKRWISLLLTLAMLVAFCVPFAGSAAAATGVSATPIPSVNDGVNAKLGTVTLEVAVPENLEVGESVVLALPSGFDFNEINKDVELAIPGKYGASVNALVYGDVSISKLSDTQIKLTVDKITNLANGEIAIIQVKLNNIYIDDGHSGEILLTVKGENAGLPTTSGVVVGTVSEGAVTVATTDTTTGNDSFSVTFEVDETMAGDLSVDDESLKFTLPSGYEWDSSNAGGIDVTQIFGDFDNDNATVTVDDDELAINVTKASTVRSNFQFTAEFSVTDESKVKLGDIVAKVAGDSDPAPATLVVGAYGDYAATIVADGDIPTIIAGKTEQVIVDLELDEGVGGSLIENRTVTLTLPDNARWNEDSLSGRYSDGAVLEFVGLQNSDRAAKFQVTGESSDAAEISLDDFEVFTEAGYSGDLIVKISGSAGVTSKESSLVVAKVVEPITATVSSVSNVRLGVASQEIGDIVITENTSGALADDGDLVITAPDGVTFATTPDVTVTSGDIQVDDVSKDSDTLTIPISSDSDTASTIKISGLKLTIDRTIPEGDVELKITGDAAIDPLTTEEDDDDNYGYWPNATTAAKVVVAKNVTAAPGDQSGIAVFKIGDASYTLNGVQVPIDVAPYIKDGRTFVPVRFAANAVGVSDANIIWDGTSRKVTVIKGDRVVQLTVGSTTVLVNGSPIVVDAAPEIVSDRLMLPIRFLGQFLGAEFVWDETAQTVTVNF